MPAYAVGHFREVTMGPEIAEYLRRIDGTLEPFGGRWVIHGAPPPEVLEGDWEGHLVVIEFPDLERARAWYASEAYRRILPLRMRNSAGAVVLVDGVRPGHRATDLLARAA